MQVIDNKFEEERLKNLLKDRENKISFLSQELQAMEENVRKMRLER